MIFSQTRPIACLIDRPVAWLKPRRTSWWSPRANAPRARTVLSLTVPCSPPVAMGVGFAICVDARLLLADLVRQAGSRGWLAQGDPSRPWVSRYGASGEGEPNRGVDRPIPWLTDDALSPVPYFFWARHHDRNGGRA
jgi:hypothetical protein